MKTKHSSDTVPFRKHRATDSIDIGKLSRESRKYLVAGYFIGFFILALLDPFITYLPVTPVIVIQEQRDPIKVILITVSKEPEPASVLPSDQIIELQKPEQEEQPTHEIQPEKFADDTDDIPEPPRISIMFQTPRTKLPDLSEKKVSDDRGQVQQIPKKRKIQQSQIENAETPEIEDERRRFRIDILGIPVGGSGGLLIHGTRHILKMIKWKIEDEIKENKIKKIRDDSFLTITEKDVRFFVLLWKYHRMNPDRLKRADREFIAESKSETIMTHRKYCENMIRRGLISSLEKSGKIVYKSNFSMEEILHTFIFTYIYSELEEDRSMVLDYIETITKCIDSREKMVIITQ